MQVGMGYMYLVKMYYNSNSVNRQKLYHTCLERAQRALKPYIIPVPGVADPPIPKNLMMSFEYLGRKVPKSDLPASEETGIAVAPSQAPAGAALAAAPPAPSQALSQGLALMHHAQSVPPAAIPGSAALAIPSAQPVRLAQPQPAPTFSLVAPQQGVQQSAAAQEQQQPQQQVEAVARSADTAMPDAVAPNPRAPACSVAVPDTQTSASRGEDHNGAGAAPTCSDGPSHAPAAQAPPPLPGA